MMLKPIKSRAERTLFYRTRMGCVVIVLWVVLSLCLVVFSILPLNYPYWIINKNSESIGLDQICTMFSKCDARFFVFSNILTRWWKAVAVFNITSIVIFCCCPFVLLLLLCLRSVSANQGFFITGILQTIGATLMISSCLLFPVGWDSHSVRKVCGESAGVYNYGDCQIGWTFILLMLAALDAVILSGVMLCMIGRATGLNAEQVPLQEGYWLKTNEDNPTESLDIS